tara:strand:- start:2000 stop:3196 length:1197 start_codon:yes stop_codon:yes gene_type:complete
MKLFRLTNFNFNGKKVLVRVGFDMPIDGKGNITDDSRIREALPTLRYLISKKAKVIVMTHHHRPDGKVVQKLKVDKIAKRLSRLLRKNVLKLDHVIGKDVEEAVEAMKSGEIVMLENLRFYKQEEKNDSSFGKKIARLGDYYVNEAFSNCHREHASMVRVPKYIPGCLGLHAYDELIHLSLHGAKKPVYAIIGGVKLKTRVPMLERFSKISKKVLLGGAMIFTFYKAMGFEIGKSLVDNEELGIAKKVLRKYSHKIVLPQDVLLSTDLKGKGKTKNVICGKIDKKSYGVDIGKESLLEFKEHLKNAKTIVWNGPMGIFEIPKFAKGTKGIATMLSKLKAKTIIGGGDTSTAIHQYKLTSKMSHVSTAGGASLTLLEGKKLVGVQSLEKNYKIFKKQLK